MPGRGDMRGLYARVRQRLGSETLADPGPTGGTQNFPKRQDRKAVADSNDSTLLRDSMLRSGHGCL